MAVTWALLHLWMLPLVKERWIGEDLKGKMARASVLVITEKLRDLAAVGTWAVAAVVLLVALANLLGAVDTVWPKAAIEAVAGLYVTTKALADGYGSVLAALGLVAAVIVLWRAARRARELVSEVWLQKANETYELLRADMSLIDAARQDPELLPIVQHIEAAIAEIQQLDQADTPNVPAIEQAREVLGYALTQLAIEMARKQVDFPGAVAHAATTEASEPASRWQRMLKAIVSKKFTEDLGLVRKPISWVVTGLLVVSLVGWAAEPLANSLQLAVNNLRVELLESQAERQLEQALSQASEPEPSTEQAVSPAPSDAATAARLLSRAFVREIARAPLQGAAPSGRVAPAEAEVVRAALVDKHPVSPRDDLPGLVRNDAHGRPTSEVASTNLKRAEEALEAPLRHMQERQPQRLATLVQRLEARYAAPLSPLDAQGKLVAKVLDEAFGLLNAEPEGELGKQAQKLARDFGKESVKTWANGALKQFLADTLAGVARPDVQRAFAFEMSTESRAFLNALQAQEGRGWRAGGIAEREARMAANVAEQVAELHASSEREMLRERLGGYERLFPSEDAPAVTRAVSDVEPHVGGGGGGGGGGKPSGGHVQARSMNFHVASRSFRVRGVLVGQTLEGTPLDATDLRWKLVPPTIPGRPTRVALEIRIARDQRTLPTWESIGAFDAGVLNQGLRYAADQRVVATTITAGDGGAVLRLTYLHPVLVDTPLGCRVVESDRLVDTFTMKRPGHRLDNDVAELANDRESMYRWIGLMELAQAVAAGQASQCPIDEVQQVVELRRLRPVEFSPSLNEGMTRFLRARQSTPTAGTELLSSAQKCARVAAPDIGRCMCKEVAPGGLPTRYWFPEDHTSQVRERKPRLNINLAWLRPSADRLGNLDFWTHTTFSVRDAQNGASDENATAALDFPPAQLARLRQVVARSIGPYVVEQLRGPSVEHFLGPLEEFVLAQRLARAALSGQLGPDFPLSRLIELEQKTRRFVASQPTMRWEPAVQPRELLEMLKKADPEAANLYWAHLEDQVKRMRSRAPVCGQASS